MKGRKTRFFRRELKKRLLFAWKMGGKKGGMFGRTFSRESATPAEGRLEKRNAKQDRGVGKQSNGESGGGWTHLERGGSLA